MFSTDASWESCWDCLAVKGQAEESLSISAPELRVLLWSTLSTTALRFAETSSSVAKRQLFCQQRRDAPVASKLAVSVLHELGKMNGAWCLEQFVAY